MSIRSAVFASLLSLATIHNYSNAESSKTSIDARSPEAVAAAFFNTLIKKESAAEMAKLMYLSSDTLWILGSRKDAEALFTKCFEAKQKQYAERGKEIKLLDVSVEDASYSPINVVIRTQEEGRDPELIEISLYQTHDGIWKVGGFDITGRREYTTIEDFATLCQKSVNNESK